MNSRFLILAILVILFLTSTTNKQLWDVGTLKQYVDTRFDAVDKAITKQENAYNERFANTNEWRSSYDDLIQTMQRDFLPRNEFNLLKDEVKSIKEKQDRFENMKAGGNVVFAIIGSIISLFIAVVSFGMMVNYRNKVDRVK